MTLLKVAQARVKESASKHDDSKYARGLAYEGFDGGYLQALYDVETMLTSGVSSSRFEHLWKHE